MVGLIASLGTTSALAWTDPTSGAEVPLPPDWSLVSVTLPLDGSLVQAVHAPTGGGFVVRVQPYDPSMLPAKVQMRVGDVEAALSADRFVQALAASQPDVGADHTVYLGFSDTTGARVGRWVFADPPTATEPARVWWHATWRVATGWAQLVAWVPETRLADFVPAMRAVEWGLGRVDGQAPPAALLWRTDGSCDGPASVDRMAAIAHTARFGVARARTPDRATELATLGGLVTDVDRCIEIAAKSANACELWEKASATERSAKAQAALVACVDAR